MIRDPFGAGLGASPLSTSPPQTRVSASTRLYLELRTRIVSLELPPNTTLDRSEIAERFEVSQSPVREAIQRLEQDSLVASYPQSRTVVTRIDRSRVRREQFLRSAVESEVARQLAERDDPKAVVVLRGHLRMQQALVDDLQQAALFKQLDDTFHEALFAALAQQALHRHVVSNSGNLARLRTLDLPRAEKMHAVYAAHRDVVDRIEARDPEGAATAMRSHLSSTIDRIESLRAAHGDYFS